jgi:hypothetical protein
MTVNVGEMRAGVGNRRVLLRVRARSSPLANGEGYSIECPLVSQRWPERPSWAE